ncbi:AAA family ATPase [Corynebacterium sp. H127]|uniref:ATP-dependent nuclease n=1 Tax=Corynebacterium sp. H127 TaxID=3133418 RepID=UPI00309D4B3D
MRIHRITVENYSRIADLEIDVRGHLVIVGANDVGKTSLLRILNLVLGPTAQLYQRLSLDDLRSQEKKLAVEVLFADLTEVERAAFHQEIDIHPEDKSESLRIRLEVQVDPDDSESVLIARWSPGRRDVRNLTREQIDTLGWRYLSSQRQSSAAHLDGASGAIQTLLQAVEKDLGDEKTAMERLLDSFNEKLGESNTLSKLRLDVAQHLSNSMPRKVDADDLAIRTATDPAQSILDNASFFVARDGTFKPLTEQSDGMRQLIAMTLFDLAEDAANVIAIDEPEIHLHPASQRTVADLLTNTTNQKILVTHSPYIVQRFDPEQVVAVRPDGSSRQLTPGKFSIEEKYRAHWWSSLILEALTARFAILVEGIADRLIVEAAARAMGISLDQIGAVVFELGGAENFPEVYKLLGKNGFGVDVLGLVDKEEKGRWIGAVGGKPKHVEGSTVFVSDADLEDEYCRALGADTVAARLIEAGVARDEKALLASCKVDNLGDVTDLSIAEFCRSRGGKGIGSRKVPAALAVSKGLTRAEVENMESIHALLVQLKLRAEA